MCGVRYHRLLAGGAALRVSTICTLVGGASVLLRASTSGNRNPFRFLHMHESFYSEMARESGLTPTFHGHVNANTGPVWVWLVQLSGWLSGDWFFGPRIVSLLAFAAGGFAVYRLSVDFGDMATAGAVSAWFTFPLSVFLAGRNQPDMLLACLVAWGLVALRGRNASGWLGMVLLGLLLKQTFGLAALVGAAHSRDDRIRYGTLLMGVSTVVVALLMFRSEGIFMLQRHLLSRLPGFGSADYVLEEGVILGFGPLAIYLAASGMREEPIRWYGFLCGAYLLFTMWAAHPGGWYYLLPAAGPLSVLMGVGLRNQVSKRRRWGSMWGLLMLAFNVPLAFFALYRYGDL